MGCTLEELFVRMSSWEITLRMAEWKIENEELEKAKKEAQKGRR